MNKLEKKFYSRQEIADLLSVNIKDTNHFKRNVETKLNKLGYEYIYSRQGVEITKQPETAEEKLIEIMLRDYKLDVRVDVKAFACFLLAFSEVEGFEAMPWTERENWLKEGYGINVSERTLRKWCNKLLETGTIAKSDAAKAYWRTNKINGKTARELVSGDEEMEAEMRQYWDCRRQLLKSHNWKETNEILWNTFGCCYYSCKFFGLSAFDTVGEVQEVYELINIIINQEG